MMIHGGGDRLPDLKALELHLLGLAGGAQVEIESKICKGISTF